MNSNGQLRTERDGDTEKGCQKPAVQQKTTDDNETYLQSSAKYIFHYKKNKQIKQFTKEIRLSSRLKTFKCSLKTHLLVK